VVDIAVREMKYSVARDDLVLQWPLTDYAV